MDYVVWDWNGTLFNDLDLCYYCINRLLFNNGYKILPTIDEYKQVFGFPIEDYYKRAGFDFTKKPYKELAHEYMDMYLPMTKYCTLAPSALQTLERFKNEGVKQYIISATKQDILDEQVDMFNIRPYFDGIYGIDNVYAASKSALAHKFLDEHRDIERILYIGDTYHDLEVALILHARAFLYSGGHQLLEKDPSFTIINSLNEITL